MELKEYTDAELRAELKRRNEAKKAGKSAVNRCRMCRHWGTITPWGEQRTSNLYFAGSSLACPFFKTKYGSRYRCHSASQKACEHFEKL